MAGSQQQDLRQIYHHIIDDVVAKMKPGFLQESVDESVLQTLRQRWSQKLQEKGVLSDPEPAPEPAARKDDESTSRKRPYDGSAPNSRQEAAAAAAAAGGGGLSGGPNLPLKGPPPHMQLRPQGQGLGPPGIPGMGRPAHPQMPMGGRGMGGPGGLTAQQHAGLQQQLQGLPTHTNLLVQSALAAVQGLPAHQQQAAFQAQLQALSRMTAAGPRGQPGLPAGLQAAAGQQVQHNQLPGGGMQQHIKQQPQQHPQHPQQQQQLQGLRPPALPPSILAAQQNLQQQSLQHQMMQQQMQLQQQQQQLQQQQHRMPVLPPGMPPNMQALLQQQQQQQQQQRIPQGDGSADVPPSVAEVAAAAGMAPERLRALLPRRIAAIMDRGSSGGGGCGRSRSTLPPAQPAAHEGVASEAAVATAGAGAAGAGSSGGSEAGAGSRRKRGGLGQHRRTRARTSIPQVDGGGDEEEEEDYVGDNAGDDGGPGGDDGDEEEGEEGEESEGESDDPELAKFTAELDDLEEADKEETGDVGFALYEKVHRAKNRWRCNLRYGVFLINNREYMFNKGSTDFTF